MTTTSALEVRVVDDNMRDVPTGEVGEVAVAVLAVRGDQNVNVADLTKFLGPRLARFKHPKDLVVVDQLPRNAGGKVLKTVLREKFGSRDAGLSRPVP